ncbi:GntR family transcriptional regulator [Labrys sp. La1]|uniref:GntR family transcriptional regulator n=1 Tax=Labrys sp. La1 TaxID=3404917 RepID=UPI003EB71767
MTSFADAKSRTLAGDIYERIRADVLACRIPPGSKLKIGDFCKRFDVSLGAVREALSRLSADGLVIAEAQKGFRVAPISREDLIDLTRTRIQIESLCLTDSIRKGDLDWETGVVASFHRLSRLDVRDPGDPGRINDDWVIAHSAFHAALVAACKSPTLLRIRKALYEQTERYRALSVPAEPVSRDINLEHRELMEATLARDVGRACELIDMHLSRTTEILLAAPFLQEKAGERAAG